MKFLVRRRNVYFGDEDEGLIGDKDETTCFVTALWVPGRLDAAVGDSDVAAR